MRRDGASTGQSVLRDDPFLRRVECMTTGRGEGLPRAIRADADAPTHHDGGIEACRAEEPSATNCQLTIQAVNAVETLKEHRASEQHDHPPKSLLSILKQQEQLQNVDRDKLEQSKETPGPPKANSQRRAHAVQPAPGTGNLGALPAASEITPQTHHRQVGRPG